MPIDSGILRDKSYTTALTWEETMDKQLVNAWFPAGLAAALKVRANALGWSRAELLRRLSADFLNGEHDDD